MNILFIGSSGIQSYEPLYALLDQGYDVCAIAYDTPSYKHQVNSEMTVINTQSRSLEALAYLHHLPIIELVGDYSESIKDITQYQPDLIIISCYPRILPAAVTSLAKLGCYNIHPSLLPAYPGPDPLFWQLRAGEQNMGVTLHRVTSVIDGGDILLQASLTLTDGLSKVEIDQVVANTAATLLLQALSDFNQLQLNEFSQNRPSANTSTAYQSFPQVSDYRINNHWSAQRLYNFISAYSRPGVFFDFEVSAEVFRISRAVSFLTDANLEESFIIEDQKISINCSPGIIECLILQPA